jgi:ABC-type multidrug transport system fused ATPase/permease subunit
LHHEFTEAEFKRAVDASGVDLFLNEEKTLASAVGENGSNLSGGQRQRIAVARALIQDKPLLILDEGTSALDRQTAVDIEQRLLDLDKLTLLTITHSLDSKMLEQYDEIIYMEDGAIVENGEFNDLLASDGKFKQYYDAV